MISVIVPIYNAQKYLNRCISSILKQTEANLEVILVDDGSTDASADICKKYVSRDPRIVFITKENGGVSSARNRGLDAATGDYVTFVDADDYLEKDILSSAVHTMETEKESLICWNTSVLQKRKEKYCDRPSVKVIDAASLTRVVISGCQEGPFIGRYVRPVWGKLFRRDILEAHAIRFDESLYIGEDAVFLLQYIKYISQMRILDQYGYHYRILQTSAVRRYKPDFLNQSKLQLHAYRKLFPDPKAAPSVDEAICSFAWSTFYAVFENAKAGCKNKRLSYSDAYEEVRKWYLLLKREKSFGGSTALYSSRFVKLQRQLGADLPFVMHVLLMCAYSVL